MLEKLRVEDWLKVEDLHFIKETVVVLGGHLHVACVLLGAQIRRKTSSGILGFHPDGPSSTPGIGSDLLGQLWYDG